MKPQNKSIRDFFSPVSRNPPSTANANTAFPQRNAHNAPPPLSRTPSSSGALPAAAPHAANTNTPLSSSNPSLASTAPSTMRAASADAPPFNPSQTSANSGTSRRVTSNGQEMVLNSDSDSDSLPDLDFGMPTPKVKMPTTTTATTAYSTRWKRTLADEDDALRKPLRKPGSDKRTFDALVRTAQKNMETEKMIQEHKAALDKSLEEREPTKVVMNEETLGQVVDDENDPEKARRLLHAMQRTNATQMESTFHFFKDTSDSIQVRARFPISSLREHRWVSNFKTANTRDQAFLTGFAQQVFRMQELPGELASWMIEQICSGRNETLNAKYLEILESHQEHFPLLLNARRLDTIFKTIGADMAQFNTQTELAPISEPQSATKPLLPPPLISIARLLERAAPWLRTKARSHALYLLCHVCLDDRVIADAAYLSPIQDAIEAIICNFADNRKLTSAVGSPPPQEDVQSLITSQLNEIVPQLLSRITQPVLQRHLIGAWPATSPLTAYLQRHLALSFLVYPTMVHVPLADPTVPEFIRRHINSSASFRNHTDYGHLAARLTLLDIAIGPGLLTVPYQPLLSPPTSQPGSSPVLVPAPASSEIRDFNKELDALVRQIKLLGNSIVEAGAVVDLAILESKDIIQRLCARLEHAVRIGGKKTNNVFGDDGEQKQLRVNRFFKKTWKTSTPPPPRGIFEGEDDAASGVGDAMES